MRGVLQDRGIQGTDLLLREGRALRPNTNARPRCEVRLLREEGFFDVTLTLSDAFPSPVPAHQQQSRSHQQRGGGFGEREALSPILPTPNYHMKSITP